MTDLTTRLLHLRRWFSPLLWRTIAQARGIQWQRPLCISLLSVLGPLVWVDDYVEYAISPWTVAWVYHLWHRVVAPLLSALPPRFQTLPVAEACFRQRCAEGRATRQATHDEYLPTTTTTNNHPDLILYPGMGVETTAYANVASQLADQGHCTVRVVSGEPARLSVWALQATGIPIGHSFGAFVALQQGAPVAVGWAMAPFLNVLPDRSTDAHAQFLRLQPARDHIADMFATPDLWKEFHRRFPQRTKQLVLEEGSTHGGFADYDDGTSLAAARTRQQSQAVLCTLDYIRRHANT